MSRTIFLSFFLTALLCGIFLSGCEGGKSRGLECSSGSSPYETCDTTPKPCPAGQQWQQGKCQAPISECPPGQQRINGICEGVDDACEQGTHLEGDVCVADQLTVEILDPVSACWNSLKGASRVILQFIARDQRGLPIDPEIDVSQEPTALSAQLLIDDELPDVESLLSRDSELLKSDLALSLVLDSTYSMLTHIPPAFEPMKTAAVDVLHEIKSIWKSNDAQFYWELTWFNDLIFRPAVNNRGEGWEISDILNLPQPAQESYTGLWKAVDYTLGIHEDLRRNGKAAGERGQHVMIIFSDGDDNHSKDFDNSADSFSGQDDLNGRLHWTYQGYRKIELQEVKDRLLGLPYLRVYVIAFGNKLKEEAKQNLQNLARDSRGQYFFGSDSKTLNQLFNSVKREFVTVQTIGIEGPISPGERQFSLHIKHHASGAEGRQDFLLEVGEQALEPCTNAP